MTELFLLYYEFFKAGLFALGGGLATIPFLSQMGDQHGWFDAQTLGDMIAISESTPGAIGVNMATYTGYHVGGVLGAFIATLGLVTPSIIIIVLIAQALAKFKENRYVQAIFIGIRPSVVALISVATLSIFTSSVIFTDKVIQSGNLLDAFDIRTILLFIFILIGCLKIKVHPIVWIALSALIGIIANL